MIELHGPRTITPGESFQVSFQSPDRVAGRVRLTAGEALVPFVLTRGDRVEGPATAHRVRGRDGTFVISDWGEHEPGTELVFRFEGAKLWLEVGSAS